jgi:NAD-dependent deacetylase
MDSFQQARELLEKAASVLVLTGAGISAESGLKTYRGDDLTWRGRPYHEVVNTEFFRTDPRASWDWHLEFRITTRSVEPNPAHRALADWAKRRQGITLVTQNIDGLHERAGQPNPVLYHGTVWETRCTECDVSRHDEALVYRELPMCAACGGLERPGVVWFGDMIPRHCAARAALAIRDAKAVLVVGTSAVVYPAAALVDAAREDGIPVIEVNPAHPSKKANLHLQGKAGEILPQLLM